MQIYFYLKKVWAYFSSFPKWPERQFPVEASTVQWVVCTSSRNMQICRVLVGSQGRVGVWCNNGNSCILHLTAKPHTALQQIGCNSPHSTHNTQQSTINTLHSTLLQTGGQSIGLQSIEEIFLCDCSANICTLGISIVYQYQQFSDKLFAAYIYVLYIKTAFF